jgi:hypothetical protein
MARKSSRKRRSKAGGSAWPAALMLVAVLALVAVFAGSALVKAFGAGRARWAASRAEGAARRAVQRPHASPERARMAVEIWNGSGSAGAGQRVAEALRDGGFQVTDIRNADRTDYGTTLVVDRKGNPRAAREVVEYLHGGFPLLMRSTLATADVRVVVGRDHRGLRLSP